MGVSAGEGRLYLLDREWEVEKLIILSHTLSCNQVSSFNHSELQRHTMKYNLLGYLKKDTYGRSCSSLDETESGHHKATHTNVQFNEDFRYFGLNKCNHV